MFAQALKKLQRSTLLLPSKLHPFNIGKAAARWPCSCEAVRHE
jgi:hypothetical protein